MASDRQHRKKKQSVIAILIVTILISLFMFWNFDGNENNSITSAAVRDIAKPSSPQEPIIQEPTELLPPIPNRERGSNNPQNQNAAQVQASGENQDSPAADASPFSRSGGGGAGSSGSASIVPLPPLELPQPKFKIRGVKEGVGIYRNGALIGGDDIFGREKSRFAVFKDSYPLAEFDIDFSEDVDFSDVRMGLNFSLGKSFMHSPFNVGNKSLYVPKRPEDKQVRVCEGAKNFEDIFEGCAVLPYITAEYVLREGDSRIETTPDGLFFIVKNVQGTGAQTENNTRLVIWDDSDYSTKYANEPLKFYANFTNRSSDLPISDSNAYCNISFADLSTKPMYYDPVLTLYNFTRTFSSVGAFKYNVTCNGTVDGFLALTVADFASISALNGPGGPDNISRGASQHGSLNPSGASVDADGKNVTPLAIHDSSITPSWQGYYGNISMRIVLQDGFNNSIYDWQDAQSSGEVFASRALDVNFPTLNCSTQQHIYIEESLLGQTNYSTDRVNRTFNRTIHPAFNVGTATYDADSCRSANLFVNDAYQQQSFYELMMSDGASNTVYTTLVENNQNGFDNTPYDFQMIVGEDGHSDNAPTTYYFFVELS